MVTGIIALALFGAAVIYALYKAFWPRKPRYVTACSVNNNVFVVDENFLEYLDATENMNCSPLMDPSLETHFCRNKFIESIAELARTLKPAEQLTYYLVMASHSGNTTTFDYTPVEIDNSSGKER